MVVGAALLLYLDPMYRFFGADDEVLADGLCYMRLIAGREVLTVLAQVLNAGFVARRGTTAFRNVLAVITILNVGLDAILLFRLSVRGA